MTRIDALVHMATSRGDELIAIEIKYSDRFNSRRVHIDREPYRALAASFPLWRDPESTLRAADVNQLVRCHALAAAVSGDKAEARPTPGLLLLHHEDDTASGAMIERYGAHLADPSLARGATLRSFIDALARNADSSAQGEIAQSLMLRYVAESESDAAWRMSGDRSVGTRLSGRSPDSKR